MAACAAVALGGLSLRSSTPGDVSCHASRTQPERSVAAAAVPRLILNSRSLSMQSWSPLPPKGISGLNDSFVCLARLAAQEPEESEAEIEAAYRELYGDAAPGDNSMSESMLAGLEEGEEVDPNEYEGRRRRRGEGGDGEDGDDAGRGPKDGFEEQVLQVRRVTKVVKGGKQLSFRAVVVVGNKTDTVGIGVGKAKEVIFAVTKAVIDAKRHLVKVPLTKYLTIPHRVQGEYGAAKVMLRPAAVGTGIIAGGAVRVVLELAGVENALGKQLGSENPLNNARAVVEGIKQLRQFREVAAARGLPMEELWK